MKALGATLVPTDTGDPAAQNFKFYNDELTVLLYEFKVDIAKYLATLANTTERTLADLIAFNIEHCSTEMRYFGQEIFELAQATSGNLLDPVYLEARMANLDFARNGINLALARGDLDAIVAPTYSFASSPAAVAGFPDISIPVGLTPKGKPAGLWTGWRHGTFRRHRRTGLWSIFNGRAWHGRCHGTRRWTSCRSWWRARPLIRTRTHTQSCELLAWRTAMDHVWLEISRFEARPLAEGRLPVFSQWN